jgi:RNA polymerase subunit RPABC4/transcription elongation factor Spt4
MMKGGRNTLILPQYSLSNFQETVRTPCMHRFCRECLQLALKRRRVCPLCNKPIATHRAIMPSQWFDRMVKIFETIKNLYEEDAENERLSQ